MTTVASEHAAAFEVTWRIAGSEHARFGKVELPVIASEVTTLESYDEDGIKVRTRTCNLSILGEGKVFPSKTPVTYRGINFRVTESTSEGRACRSYTVENP